jgi:hypothetical protein
MKGLFFLLLLFNAALLGWGYMREPDLRLQEIAVPSPIGSMRLLREIPPAQLAHPPRGSTSEDEPLPPPAGSSHQVEAQEPKGGGQPLEPSPASPPSPSAASETSPAPAAEAGGQPIQAEVPAAPPAQPAPPPITPPLVEKPTVEKVVEKKEPPKPKEPAPKPDKKSGAKGEGEEKAVAAKVAEVSPGQGASGPVVDAPKPSGCGAFGPILDRAGVAVLLADLMRYGITPSVLEQRRELTLFSVTTPSILTTVEAQRVLTQLQSRGFRNVTLMRSEGGRQFISLGDYPTLVEAEQFAERMRGAGFSAEVKGRQEGRSEFWLEFPLQHDLAPGSDAWQGLRTKHGALGPLARSCGRVP